MTAAVDLDAIAKRITIARDLFGDRFDVGTVELETGQLTPRPTIDILRDRDRLALFDEVIRLQHQQQQARALLIEGLGLFTDHETTLLALFDEVIRLQHQQQQARALLIEGLGLFTDHETTLERVEAWLVKTRRAVGEVG